MPITPEQRSRRREGVGASDVPAILGVDPYRSAADVWIEKVYPTEDIQSDASEEGTILEPAIVQIVERRLGEPVERDQFFALAGTRLAANLDGLTTRSRRPVEVKAPLRSSHRNPHEWGDAMSDVVPDKVLVQVQAQMICAEAGEAVVGALLGGGRGFSMYIVPRNDGLRQVIIDAVGEFWDCVKQGRQPSESKPHLETVQRVIRTPGKTIDLDAAAEQVVAEWQILRQARLDAEKAEEQAKADVIAMLGDAEAARLQSPIDGKRTIKYMSVRQSRLDQSALKSAHPDIAAEFTKEGAYRKLALVKGD